MHSNLDVELEPVIGRVTAARAAQSRAEADELLALADAARAAVAVPSESELRMRSVAAELACAARVSDRTMMRRLDEATGSRRCWRRGRRHGFRRRTRW